MTLPIRQDIVSQSDIEQARRAARTMTGELHFSIEEAEAVVIATIELATNLLRYGAQGYILLTPITGPGDADRAGLEVQSRDHGPGIEDLDRALEEGFSTHDEMGSGLPAVRRLMDDVVIETAPTGTCIVARKWASRS
jgi:serine/threonine-protein kinase RsbT